MLKKYITILLLCVANFLIVGHSIIPHDHVVVNAHEKQDHHHFHTTSHHHQHDHHQNPSKDQKEEDHSNIFDFYSHTAEYVRNEGELKSSYNDYKDDLILLETSSPIYALSVLSTFRADRVFYRDPDYKPPTDYQSGLRAPPLFFF